MRYKKGVIDILRKCESTDQFDGRVVDVNQKNWSGDSLLHMVVHWDDLTGARLLIEAGANINAQGERGFTPLFFARSLEMAKLLIGKGADPRIFGDNGKMSPDKCIRLINHPEIADYIAGMRN